MYTLLRCAGWNFSYLRIETSSKVLTLRLQPCFFTDIVCILGRVFCILKYLQKFLNTLPSFWNTIFIATCYFNRFKQSKIQIKVRRNWKMVRSYWWEMSQYADGGLINTSPIVIRFEFYRSVQINGKLIITSSIYCISYEVTNPYIRSITSYCLLYEQFRSYVVRFNILKGIKKVRTLETLFFFRLS